MPTDYPLSPTIISAIVSGVVALLIFAINHKMKKIEISIKAHNVEIAEYSTHLAQRMADLKEVELSNASAHRTADALLRRYETLRSEVAELNALLTLFYKEKEPAPDETKRRALLLCSSISHTVTPKGAFCEEFIIQLGHIREFFCKGSGYWENHVNFMTNFDLNCWLLVDSEYSRILKTLETGLLSETQELTPYKCEYKATRT